MPYSGYLFLFLLLLSGTAQSQITRSDSLLHDGLHRQYILHMPPAADTLDELPLVFTLHGGGGSAAGTINFTRLNPVADRHGFLLVYPQGYTTLPTGGFAWADGRGTQADTDGIDDVGFLLRLLDTLLAEHPIDTNRIYLNGFSNGGFMTQRMACEAPERFAAMASLGCTMDTALFARCDPGQALPMLLLMGTSDPFVPYDGGPMNGPVLPVVAMDSLFQFWAAQNECRTVLPPEDLPDQIPEDHCTVTRLEQTDCTCGADVRLFRINGGGHTWPGVELPAYELIAGETNEDIEAGEELWAFFRRFSRCEEVVSVAEPPERDPRVRLYPNPARNRLHLEAYRSIRSVQLVDLTGRQWLRLEPNSRQAELDLWGVTDGLYSVIIHFQNGDYYPVKLIVK